MDWILSSPIVVRQPNDEMFETVPLSVSDPLREVHMETSANPGSDGTAIVPLQGTGTSGHVVGCRSPEELSAASVEAPLPPVEPLVCGVSVLVGSGQEQLPNSPLA